ncbi:MAG TPA: AMP-binding protein, partial [Victivallales bacterium]|nr:AMP-binding protein [Victivallales bacterium]
MEKNKEKTLNNLFISSEEYNTVIYNWNDTESPYPKNKTIHQLFEEQVERTPNNIAVIFEDIRLTYKELNKKSNQLAFIIRETYKEIYNTNLLPDTLIPICVEKSHEMIIGILGILKAGGAYVPIASNLPDKRIKDILNNTGAKLILTEKKILRQNSALQKINNIIINDTSITSFPKSYSFHLTTNSKSLAYVIYTSGSTGSPNGVMIEHRSFINYYINFLK